jgi:hypothetical protein
MGSRPKRSPDGSEPRQPIKGANHGQPKQAVPFPWLARLYPMPSAMTTSTMVVMDLENKMEQENKVDPFI